MRLLTRGNVASFKRNTLRAAIKRSTEISRKHLTPEIKLHLITPLCPLWSANPENCQFKDPFWAFYWAGGQALTRFILDNRAICSGKNVIDIGSGCGACSIAAAFCGAKSVIANDIDLVSCEAISMNCSINGTKVHICNKNLIDYNMQIKADVILVGDMFYDSDFGEMLFNWLRHCKITGITILIGDPGRHALAKSKQTELKHLHEYSLPQETILENNGFSTSTVWEM